MYYTVWRHKIPETSTLVGSSAQGLWSEVKVYFVKLNLVLTKKLHRSKFISKSDYFLSAPLLIINCQDVSSPGEIGPLRPAADLYCFWLLLSKLLRPVPQSCTVATRSKTRWVSTIMLTMSFPATSVPSIRGFPSRAASRWTPRVLCWQGLLLLEAGYILDLTWRHAVDKYYKIPSFQMVSSWLQI